MAVAIFEVLGKKENSFMDIFSNGSNNQIDNGIRLVGGQTFKNKEAAEKYMVDNVIPLANKEANEEYEKVKKFPNLYDLDNLNKGLTEGYPLVAKNLIILNVEAFYVIKGFPDSDETVKEAQKTYNDYRTIFHLKIKEGQDTDGLFELVNGKIFFRFINKNIFRVFETFKDGKKWLEDPTLELGTKMNEQEFNDWFAN